MAETELINLKKKRGLLRTSVTNILKRIETELHKTEVDCDELEEILENLDDKFQSLKRMDSDIESLIETDDIDKEFETSTEYREKIITWTFRAKKKLKCKAENVNKFSESSSSSQPTNNETKTNSSQHETMTVKLPKIMIPKFYGDVSQWLTFWNSFETAIDKNEYLDPVSKFNYLKAHLGSTALGTVEGFAISAENYTKATELLKDRFGKKDTLINAHMNNLLQLSPLKRSSDIKNFRKLFDNCQTQIRSLETLGISAENFGSILCPMIFKLLPRDLVFEFNKEYDASSYTLNDLIEFLSKQLNAREKTDGTCYADVSENRNSSLPSVFPRRERYSCADVYEKPKSKQNVMSAAGLLSSRVIENNKICVFCDGPHLSSSCEHATDLTLEERKSVLFKKGACFRCCKLKHRSNECRSKITCNLCGKRHLDIMCFSIRDKCVDPSIKNENSAVKESTVLSNQSCSKEVYLQTIIVKICTNKMEKFVRILIDTGSQRSYVSKFVAKRMGLKCLGQETINHGLFGGIENVVKHKRHFIKLMSIDRGYSCEFEAMDQEIICASIPKLDNHTCKNKLKHHGIYVSDIEVNKSSCLFEKNSEEIHLLIGADIAGKLFTGDVKHIFGDLYGVHTHLGWTVMGKVQSDCKMDSSLLVLSLFVNNAKLNDLWSLDSLGITDPGEKRSKEELQELALKHFQKTVTRDDIGRYKVCLPWLEGHPPLADHKNLAENRLKNTVKSLKNMNRLKDYQKVLEDWEGEGIIERISKEQIPAVESAVHYLPHRAVIKEHSTTKIRPVFDASANTRNSPALNECVEKGPNLIELIPAVLTRFRTGKIGAISDIRKAFLQISLQDNDRNFLRFLWWKDGDPNKVITYRHCRVVFGISSSPFLLAAVLNHLLDQVPNEQKQLATKLKESMYVDNCVTSVDSIEELENFRVEAQKILAAAQFDLRGWRNNELCSQNSQNLENSEVPVLGLSWNVDDDTLSCDYKDEDEKYEPVTKRKILSVAHKIFDPIGFTCPFSLIPKLILQECWKIEATWDKALPDDISRKFRSWKKQIQELKNVKIPRKLTDFKLSEANISLHTFCDACASSYAACVFLRVEAENAVSCQLVQARSKVAPLKRITIPRLELLACNIGARLANTVKTDLKRDNIETFYWSDSMDALYWIKKRDTWGVFISNRVEEIRSLSSAEQWNFVPGIQNPADLPSRGCSVKRLVKEKWWEGPIWLKSSRDEWPNFQLIPDEEVVNSEKRKIVVSSFNKNLEHFYHDMSSYKKIIRTTSWIYRFYENCKNPKNKRFGELTREELEKAERIVLKRVQEEIFIGGSESDRLKLLPIIADSEGLLRVKTKVYMRDDKEDFRTPVVLPADHNVVKSLIIEKHKELGHSGVQMMINTLREKYWILKGRRAIKRIIKTCVVCQRFSVKPPSIPEGPLPEDRIKDARVFEIIGCDVAGPVFHKNRQKAWILILTCAIYRAVHLELLTSLSTDNFVLALRRFIARRGRPAIVYSDNGTNFVGTANFLQSLNLEKLKIKISPIAWKFIPPSAPWWGGFWERLIGLMKRILVKILGRNSLTYEELMTVLCDCENLLNNRPLTYVSEDINDLRPIVPAMFLRENQESKVTDLDQFKCLDRAELNKRLKYRLRLLKDLRARFRIEYLGQLRQNYKKHKVVYIPKVGDIVLIVNDKLKRLEWPLGKILEIYPSGDGFVRLVKIKTQSGVLIRTVQKLCPLELDDTSDIQAKFEKDSNETTKVLDDTKNTDVIKLPVVTRTGRCVRAPQRYIEEQF